MSRSIDGAGAALRRLRVGQASARQVADFVGWAPRTAGPKMRALELQGLVLRVMVKDGTVRSDAKYEWALTDRGRALSG